MEIFHGVFVMLGIHLVSCQRTPIITHITQKPIKDIGDTVELTCSVLYAREFPVLWVKVVSDDIVVISNGYAIVIKDSRFTTNQDIDHDRYTLKVANGNEWTPFNDLKTITGVQETDAGLYQCQLYIGANQKIHADVDVYVRKPPIIFDNSTRSLIVNGGQPAKLECYAGGYPIPRVSWRRVNNGILTKNKSMFRGNILIIQSVTKDDRGTYYCVAENGVGRGVRRNIAVEVISAPVVTTPNSKVGQALQYDIVLDCHVEAYPPPAIVWILNGVILSNNQHYIISHFATADEITDTSISVITIEKRQYGDYICKAFNVLGTAEVTVQLRETIMPICPPACEDRSIHSINSSVSSTSVNSVACLIITFLYFVRFLF